MPRVFDPDPWWPARSHPGGFSFGNTRLIFGHVKALTTALAELNSEEACQDWETRNMRMFIVTEAPQTMKHESLMILMIIDMINIA